jgi:hypothetical protein
MGLTLTQFLKKKFKGKELVSIPKYSELPIRPDIVALAVLNKNDENILGWIIGECKVSGLTTGDLRQAVYNSGIAEAYESYLFLEGSLSEEAKKLIETGGHSYSGTNRWGKPVKKRLIIIIYENGRFSRTLL